MKYSQYNELEKVLNENGLSIQEVKEDPELFDSVLNESILTILGGIGLVAAILTWGKALMRLGVKRYHILRLNQINKKFERVILDKIDDLFKATEKTLDHISNLKKEYEEVGTGEAKRHATVLESRKVEVEKRLLHQVNSVITKAYSLKGKEITNRIDNIKRLRESQRTALRLYWELLIAGTRVNISNQMIERGLITDEKLLEELKEKFSILKDDAEEKFKGALKNIKREDKEEIEVTDKEKRETDPNKILDYVQKISAKREEHDLSDEKVIKYVTRLIEGTYRVKDEEIRKRLLRKIENEFGEDIFEQAKLAVKDIDQTVLKDEDDL